ncbi:MAG: response regulator [Acidobacteriota bacterium]|nr:response regulator [Acidobacteriota bacterium]
MKLDLEPNIASIPLAENIDINAVVSENNSPEISQMLRDGIKAAQEGDRTQARQLLMRVTEADSNSENAWLWLASISEYPEELLVFLSNVLNINPENERAIEWVKATKSLMAKTFVQNGINAAKEDRKDFARQCFFQAIVHHNENEMAWLWLASVTDSPDEKVSHLQKVLNINPENENAVSAMANAKKQIAQAIILQAKQAVVEDKRDEAQNLLQTVLQESPNSEDALLIKAHLSDSFNEKVFNLEKVLEINSDNEAAKAGLDFLTIFGEVSKPQEEIKEQFETEEESQANFNEEAFEDSEEQVEPAEEMQVTQEFYVEEQEFQPENNEEQEFQPTQAIYDNGEPEVFFAEEQIEVFENAESVEYSAEYENPESDYSAVSEEYSETQEIQVSEEMEDGVDMEQNFEDAEVSYAEFEQSENEKFEDTEDAEVESFQSESNENESENSEAFEEFEQNPVYEQSSKLMSYPFCNEANEPQSFVCKGCSAILTLSDIEMVLGHEKANEEIVGQSVEMMETQRENRDFDAEELKFLGIGYLNLKDLRKGFSYLQEAVQVNQDDVVLISQVDALAIRIAEIEQQNENKSSESRCVNILVVDDSPTVRKLISSKLEKCGHEVICAVDGMDALEKIEESIPDLILLDITMPRMDGYQVCKQIRSNEATQNIPIVMISGNDGFFDKVRGKMAGTTNYITKPFGHETLMKTVNEYIQ